MLNNAQATTTTLRLARLAWLRARLARCAAAEEAFARPSPPHHNHSSFVLPRGLATDASYAAAAAGQAPAASKASPDPQYREYAFALTPQHARVTVVCSRRARTPVAVATSPDPERIVVRAPLSCSSGSSGSSTWSVELGAHGPEAREIVTSAAAIGGEQQQQSPPPPPPPPLEVLLPARFCGLDVASAGGDVTVGGSGVQEADVRIVVVNESAPPNDDDSTPTTTPTTTTTIAATRLRCGALVLDAGPAGRVAAKEVAASRLEVRAGRGVELGRVSALDALVEAGGKLEVGALYGRAAVLRLLAGKRAGEGAASDGNWTAPPPLPLLRVNHLSCGGDDDEGGGETNCTTPPPGATLEAWPRGGSSGAIAVRVDGALAGRAAVASGGGPVSLGAVQAAGGAGGLRSLAVDSGGGDVDVSLDTGGGGGGGMGRAARGGGGGGGEQAAAAAAAAAALRLRVQGAAGQVSVDPALGLLADGRVPVYGGGARDSDISIDAGGRGRVSLRARSWMDGVMARAAEAAAARAAAGGGGERR